MVSFATSLTYDMIPDPGSCSARETPRVAKLHYKTQENETMEEAKNPQETLSSETRPGEHRRDEVIYTNALCGISQCT